MTIQMEVWFSNLNEKNYYFIKWFYEYEYIELYSPIRINTVVFFLYCVFKVLSSNSGAAFHSFIDINLYGVMRVWVDLPLLASLS